MILPLPKTEMNGIMMSCAVIGVCLAPFQITKSPGGPVNLFFPAYMNYFKELID